jgi:hypothetical protein
VKAKIPSQIPTMLPLLMFVSPFFHSRERASACGRSVGPNAKKDCSAIVGQSPPATAMEADKRAWIFILNPSPVRESNYGHRSPRGGTTEDGPAMPRAGPPPWGDLTIPSPATASLLRRRFCIVLNRGLSPVCANPHQLRRGPIPDGARALSTGSLVNCRHIRMRRIFCLNRVDIGYLRRHCLMV